METETETETGHMKYWNPDSKVTASIEEYIDAVSDEASDMYVPEEDRIAVFDLDGTLAGELYPTYFDWCMFVDRALHDPTYEAPADMKEFATKMEQGMAVRSLPEETEELHAKYAPLAYKGMTVDQYMDYVREYKNSKATGFVNMTRGEAFFKPMISLVKNLAEHNFTVYICSGTDRNCVRAQIEGYLDEYIPVNRVIGTDNTLVATNQENHDGLDYVFSEEDNVVYGGELIVKNIKMNKVSVIAQEIGKQPILAFGNSSGDLSMAQYATDNPNYQGRAYLLLCDDTERDYGNVEKANKLKETCDKLGFYTVSEKNDWETIYGDDIVLTKSSEKTEEDYINLLPKYSYTLNSVQGVNGRQGICKEGDFYYVSGSKTLTKYDKDWNVVLENTEPFEGYELEVNHIGDIDIHNGELYLGVEYFDDGVGKNIQVAVYDSNTLKLKRVFPFSADTGQIECSGIAVDPDNGFVYMCSWVDDQSSSYIYKYDLNTGDYIGKIHLQPYPQWMQGIAYYDGNLYVTCDDGNADDNDPDHMYKINIKNDNSATVILEKTFDDVILQGEIEGLTFDKENNQFLLLYNRGAKIVNGMPTGFYDGYTEEIHEVFIYDMSI